MHALSGWHHVHGGKVYVCQLDYHGKRMNVCDIVEFEDGMIKADRGYFAEPFEAPEGPRWGPGVRCWIITRGRRMRKMVMLVSAVVAAVGLAVAGPATERG